MLKKIMRRRKTKSSASHRQKARQVVFFFFFFVNVIMKSPKHKKQMCSGNRIETSDANRTVLRRSAMHPIQTVLPRVFTMKRCWGTAENDNTARRSDYGYEQKTQQIRLDRFFAGYLFIFFFTLSLIYIERRMIEIDGEPKKWNIPTSVTGECRKY